MVKHEPELHTLMLFEPSRNGNAGALNTTKVKAKVTVD
jgi:hypothetical protein